MGFAFPREERDALVAAQPQVFHQAGPADLRFPWVEAWLAELDRPRMEELVIDAWRRVVPKGVAAAHLVNR